MDQQNTMGSAQDPAKEFEEAQTQESFDAPDAKDPEYQKLMEENLAVLGDEYESCEDEDQEPFDDNDGDIIIEGLKAQINALMQKSKADQDRLMLALADADNARKRAEADVERERKYALEKFVKALLPVVDALDRALELSDRTNPALKPTLDGVDSTMQLFLKELSSFGVERIDPKGQTFDPNLHQAVAVAPSDQVAPNTVIDVMQKGFLLNGRVVRPAMVVVSKQPEAPGLEGGINIQA